MTPSPDQQRDKQTRQAIIRRRNWAIFLAVIFLALLFFVMTIVRTQL